MISTPHGLYFCGALLALFSLMIIIRAAMDWRERRRARRRLTRIAQHGERRFCGQDWTLPQWERHETAATKRRIRTTHGGVVLDCLGLLLCSYALLAVLWLFATGVFAL